MSSTTLFLGRGKLLKQGSSLNLESSLLTYVNERDYSTTHFEAILKYLIYLLFVGKTFVCCVFDYILDRSRVSLSQFLSVCLFLSFSLCLSQFLSFCLLQPLSVSVFRLESCSLNRALIIEDRKRARSSY